VNESIHVRAIAQADFAQWKPLWDGYNAFYGRLGNTALPEHITQATWQRFFDETEPVFGLVANEGSTLVGLAHYLFHRSTTRIEAVCYMQDLFTEPSARGRGVARALIEGVYREAQSRRASRVYWHTQASNVTARMLYDKVAKHYGFVVYTADF
jgi:GNAT superfamily N-acetyltransferase